MHASTNEHGSGRVLVAVGGGARTSTHLIEAGRALAAERGDELYVIMVEPQDRRTLLDVERAAETQRAAAIDAGATFIRRRGDDPALAILQEAQALAATTIVLGESERRWWQSLLFGSPRETIERSVAGVEVRVVSGDVPSSGSAG